MPSQKLYTSGRTIDLAPASLDNVEGFATAHIEQLQSGKQVVVGTFKGERTFHDAHKGTSARMTFRGVVEEGEKAYRVTVPVNVRIQVRTAKFKSTGTIVAWKELEND